MREIRTLRAMLRALETESRQLLNGHESGNAGYSQGVACGPPRQCSILPGSVRRSPGDCAPPVPGSPIAEVCRADPLFFARMLADRFPSQFWHLSRI